MAKDKKLGFCRTPEMRNRLPRPPRRQEPDPALTVSVADLKELDSLRRMTGLPSVQAVFNEMVQLYGEALGAFGNGQDIRAVGLGQDYELGMACPGLRKNAPRYE